MNANLPCRRIGLLVTLVLIASGGAVFAQPATSSRPSTDRWEPDRLRAEVEARYRVVPLNDGVVLVPQRESGAVKSIEVRGDMIAINGSPVTGAEVRQRLGADAGPILALSYLDPQARRALFERSPAAAPPSTQAPEPAQPSPAPEAETPPAQPPAPEEQVPGRRSRNRSDARVHIGGSVNVDENEIVHGPAVAIGGSVTVNGEVQDDVVAIGGSVRLGPRAKVDGDVTSVGGRIDRDPHAEVTGKLNEIGFGRFPHIRIGPAFWFPRSGFLSFGPWVELMATLFRMVLFAVLVFLVFLLARQPVGRIERAAAVEPWKAGLVGLLTEVLFVPVFVLTCVILAISIIGIPLLFILVPLAIVALLGAFVFGFAGIVSRIGAWAHDRFRWGAQSPFVLLLVGLLGIWAFTIVGRIVSLGGWPIWFLSAALLVTGFLVEYVAWTIGLGATILTRFGTRPIAGDGPASRAVPATPAGPGGSGPA